ncbi:MAG: IS3 family transposase [Salinivirgaceae bacterium]|jgi:putative transposase|nr:IS3 family transposase [Salinivirgaceae bacterium]
MKELESFIGENIHLSIRRQSELLEVNRSNLYYNNAHETDENLTIMRLMDEHYLEHPTYGVLQMQDYLFALGFIVNHKRVRRLLRLMGIMAIFPKRNLSKLGKAKYIRPYLLRGMEINKPNQVWEIDITYIPMKKGFMYLTAIIDVYSRFVVGWNISNSLAAENCLSVLTSAIDKYGQPDIVNSDQGSQFTSALWTEYLDNENIKISMDGKGRALDNIFIERLWRTVKQDYIYISPIEDGLELKSGLKTFFEYYNKHKTHQGIERQIPFYLYTPAA